MGKAEDARRSQDVSFVGDVCCGVARTDLQADDYKTLKLKVAEEFCFLERVLLTIAHDAA
jgi:hypothetical protein